MKKLIIICLSISITFSVFLFAEEVSNSIELLKPQIDEKPLLKIMNERMSTREYSDKEIPDQMLSNLLWAAFGINRPETGMRTAPSAINAQEIDIYAATADGLYLYEPKEHVLELIHNEDIREHTGNPGTEYTKTAPLNLILVLDSSKFSMFADYKEMVKIMAFSDAGFIGQNIYLFCASEKLATVVLGAVASEKLHKLMKLRDEQSVLFSLPVGYFKIGDSNE